MKLRDGLFMNYHLQEAGWKCTTLGCHWVLISKNKLATNVIALVNMQHERTLQRQAK